MKKYVLLLPLFAGLLLFYGCPYGYKYNEGKFPVDPVNLTQINSMYDDFNMTAPTIEGRQYLYFSSNRNSYGNDFDVVGDHFHISWDRDKGVLTVDDKPHSWKDYRYTDSLFARMNTPANEYGPYSLPFYSYRELNSYYSDFIIFANDSSGNLDLSYVGFRGEGETPGPFHADYYGPGKVQFLNSPFNDAYLTFYGDDFVLYEYGTVPEEIREVYFCSDRQGNYDIFQSPYPAGWDLLDYLQADTAFPVNPAAALNSAFQDKCPYVNGDVMVFASDRPGGYGGFDLYYSRREGNSWSVPVNFGDKINTSHNEYRPIVMLFPEFKQDLMLFSSDRPGGEGGYDLYFVGIPRMIE